MIRKKLALLCATCLVVASSTTYASTFVLMRGGDATFSQATYGNGEVPAYLDQYSITVSGGVATPAYSGSYAIDPNTLTLPGILVDSHEGRLELSGNGQYLDFGGYQAPVSTTTPRVTDGSGTGSYYQIGQVGAGGSYTSASLDTSVTNPQFVRAAYSNDGTQAWVATKNPNGGLAYVSGIGGSTTTVALQNTTDWRDLKVSGGQLFGGTGSSSVGTHAFYAIGSGQPTSGTPANTRLTGTVDNSTSGFAFATLPGTQPITGVNGTANTAYIVGDPSGNAYIGKLASVSGTPLTVDNLSQSNNLISRQIITAQIGTPEGIVAQIDPDNATWVDLFVQNASGVYFAVDTSGASNASFGTLTFTKIISTTSDTAFYGIANNTPSVVPEPSTFVLAGAGAIGLLGGLRRRRAVA